METYIIEYLHPYSGDSTLIIPITTALLVVSGEH